jgi:hypothetical protein
MRKFLDKFSLYWDFTNGAGSLGKAHPVKPIVRDLQGDFASVVRNSPKNLTQKTGLIGSIPANTIPYRWDGNRFGAFVEPSAVNIILRSDNPTVAPWNIVNYTTSSAPSILGISATRLTKNASDNGLALGTGSRNVRNVIGTWSTGIKTIQIAIRRGNTDAIGLNFNGFRVSGSAEANPFCTFNFTNDTFVNFRSGLTLSMVSFEKISNDEYIIYVTFNDDSTSTGKEIWLSPTDVGGAFGGNVATGNYFDFAFIQGETGSVATSYIKTEGSAQTRNADVITLSNIPDLIGQTQGFIYAEVDVKLVSASFEKQIVSIFNTSNTGLRLSLSASTDNRLQAFVADGGTPQVLRTNVNQPSGFYKILLHFDGVNIKLFINGTLIATNNIAKLPLGLSAVKIGTAFNDSLWFNDTIYRVGIGKEILSDEEAIFMTTL